MIATSLKPCIVIVLDIPFNCTTRTGALDLYFMFLIILPDAGAISTSAAFLSKGIRDTGTPPSRSVLMYDHIYHLIQQKKVVTKTYWKYLTVYLPTIKIKG